MIRVIRSAGPRADAANGPPGHAGRRPNVFYIECHTCGHEPADQEQLPVGRCPKCFCHTWRRVARPHMLLRDPAA